jgi:hypothetical protein
MSQFTDKYRNDLKLLLDTPTKTVNPKYLDAFAKRIAELQRQFSAYLDKQESIATSGRFSPDGELLERRLAARPFKELLTKARAETVDKLDAQLAEQRAAALKPKTKASEPLEAIVKEMRLRELRDHLRQLDPLQLQARIKQAVDDGADTTLLDALEGAPVGFSIAPPELVQATRETIALRDHPELGELAQLKTQYDYALGVTEQTLLAASRLTPVELGTDPAPPTRDTRPSYRVSTGEPVTT